MKTEWRLKVDWIKCDGYGLCGDYAPDLVVLDDWRFPILLPTSITTGLLQDAQRAVDCCPAYALSLEKVAVEDK
ncbi:MAG: ferredoxin [Chloroflexota bacterium]